MQWPLQQTIAPKASKCVQKVGPILHTSEFARDSSSALRTHPVTGTKQLAIFSEELVPAADTVPIRDPVSTLKRAPDTLRGKVHLAQHKAGPTR